MSTWVERFERNTQIVEAFAEGKSLTEIRRLFRMERASVLNVLRAAAIHPRVASRSFTQRNEAMLKASRLGVTLVQIAERFGVSRTRAQQVVAKERDREGEAHR